MFRFLKFGQFGRAAKYFCLKQKISLRGASAKEECYLVGVPYSLFKSSSRYRTPLRGYTSFTLCRTRDSKIISSGLWKFYCVASRGVISQHAQVAWRRLSHLCTFSGPVLPPINKIACAVSLALTRSNLIAPGVISIMIGHLACSQPTWAEAEPVSAKDTLYMQAQDGQIYVTGLVLVLFETLVLLLRTLYLAILFLPSIAMAPLSDSFGCEVRKAWLHVLHRTLEKAGPAFIKWGQWAATRPDLFPGDLCAELSKLHTKAPAHSFSFTKRTIENAFGRKLHEIFESFEAEPVASGSVAQVHRAILKYRYPGRASRKPVVVAVKVRHPGVGEAIRRDFMIINFVAKISKFLPGLNWLRLDESIQQFAVFMMSQVDLAREAANLNRFIYNFRRWKDVSFPKPLYPLVHPAVLVETYEQGESVLHYVDKLQGHEELKSSLAHIGTNALLKMLLVDNFVHADMHPGNILVRLTQNNLSTKQLFHSRPHVVFLDVGMTAELCKRDRKNILDFFKAVALRDGRAAAESTLKLSRQQNCPNPMSFIEDVERTFSFWDSPDGDLIQPADCIQELLEQVRRHRVNIDGNVCTVIVTTMVLEGWQHKLDPEYNVMRTLRTLLFKADWAESLSYTIEGLMAP